jgi:hypothetical protein
MIDKAVSSFTLPLSPAYLILSLVQHRYAIAAILGAWWMISRSAKKLTLLAFLIVTGRQDKPLSCGRRLHYLIADGELDPYGIMLR